MDDETEFTIKCRMKSRWVPYFTSMLKKMQHTGEEGAKRIVGIMANGETDFKPSFEMEASPDMPSVGEYHYRLLTDPNTPEERLNEVLADLAEWYPVANPIPGNKCEACLAPGQSPCRQCVVKALTEMLTDPGHIYDAG